MNYLQSLAFTVVSAFSLIAFPAAGPACQPGSVEDHNLRRASRPARLQPERKDKMHDALISHDSGGDGVPVGMWGGEHISLQVTEHGARVEYDCAHGTIDRRIVPDRRGRFDVPGTHVEEHGGPVRETARTGGYRVRFTGRIKGREMEITVTRSGNKKIIGTYSLVYEREPSLVKCR